MARFHAFSAFAYCHASLPAPGSSGRGAKSKKSAESEDRASQLDDFCSKNNLHLPTLKRSLELRNQLYRVYAKVFDSSSSVKDSSRDRAGAEEWAALSPPSLEEELTLRQVIVSGFVDCIARRAPLHFIKVGSRRRRLTAYLSADGSVGEPVYIHPSSTLYRKDPTATLPEFVVYDSLIKNARGDLTYMSNVNTVDKSWISTIAGTCPLLKWSEPLVSPSPYYDASLDAVMCMTTPRYGPYNWELPIARKALLESVAYSLEQGHGTLPVASAGVGFRQSDEHYRWFARLLLEGAVLASEPAFKGLLRAQQMRDPPACITQKKPLDRVLNLLLPLIKHEVFTKASLMSALREDSQFLSEEVQAFLRPEARAKFRLAWSQLAASAMQ